MESLLRNYNRNATSLFLEGVGPIPKSEALKSKVCYLIIVYDRQGDIGMVYGSAIIVIVRGF